MRDEIRPMLQPNVFQPDIFSPEPAFFSPQPLARCLQPTSKAAERVESFVYFRHFRVPAALLWDKAHWLDHICNEYFILGSSQVIQSNKFSELLITDY